MRTGDTITIFPSLSKYHKDEIIAFHKIMPNEILDDKRALVELHSEDFEKCKHNNNYIMVFSKGSRMIGQSQTVNTRTNNYEAQLIMKNHKIPKSTKALCWSRNQLTRVYKARTAVNLINNPPTAFFTSTCGFCKSTNHTTIECK